MYSRKDIIDWVVGDFQSYYINWYAGGPMMGSPPSPSDTVTSDIFRNEAYIYNTFGPCYKDTGEPYMQHSFYVGYWTVALCLGEVLGFNQALRDADEQAGEILDWLLEINRKRLCSRLLGGMLANTYNQSDYLQPIWTEAQVSNAIGIAFGILPQSFADVATSQGANAAPSWDTHGVAPSVGGKDGQSMDQLLSHPSWMLRTGFFTGSALTELEAAHDQAMVYLDSKVTSETARGFNAAGSVWFKYLQITNSPIVGI